MIADGILRFLTHTWDRVLKYVAAGMMCPIASTIAHTGHQMNKDYCDYVAEAENIRVKYLVIPSTSCTTAPTTPSGLTITTED